MIFDFLKRKSKRSHYPETAKYKAGDFVRFRYRGEVTHGFIYDAKESDDGKILYTLQKGGECPSFVYDYEEKDIIGLMNK